LALIINYLNYIIILRSIGIEALTTDELIAHTSNCIDSGISVEQEFNFIEEWATSQEMVDSQMIECFEITTPGIHRLSSDVDGSSLGYTDSCILIYANDVTLDCAGHTIHGWPSFPSGNGPIGITTIGRLNNIKVWNCNLEGFYLGINYREVNGGEIMANSVTRSGWGIATHRTQNVDIFSNELYGNKGGITVQQYSSNMEVNINGVYDNDIGIYLYASSNIEVADNTLNSSRGGIYLYSSPNWDIQTNDNTISGNIVRDSTGYGLYFTQLTHNNIVSDNYFCNTADKDIIAETGSTNRGVNNNCDSVDNWIDDGAAMGCYFPC